MALTANVELLNTLPAVVLSGNKIPLKLQASTNMYEVTGKNAVIVLHPLVAGVADDYVDLLLFGETVRFTCKAAPDNSGAQFHDNSLNQSLPDWIALFADDLSKNYLISRYYDVDVTNVDNVGADIVITAKQPGAAYTLNLVTQNGTLSIYPDPTNRTGIDGTLRAFYGIVVLLYCNTEFVSELVLNIDNDGLAEVDVSGLLKPYLTPEFEWPESDADFIFPRTGSIASWYFLYGERWGVSEYQATTKSDTYNVLFGGVSWMQQAKYNADNITFWVKLCNNKYFLSWAPVSKYIGPEEPLKLYFLNHSAATTLKAQVKLYYASGNNTITIDTVTGVADKAVHEIVLSPVKLVYTGLADNTLVKIDVWIDNENDVPVSEVRTFIFDYTHYEHTRYFLFRNSLGAYEVLRTTGLLHKSEEYDREMASVDVASDYTGKDRQEVSVSNFEQQKYTLSAGWLSRYANADEYRNWLRDFSLSKEVYQLVGSSIKPVRLISTNLDHGKDRDSVKGFTFEFVNAFTDEHFTKEITWNLFNGSFNSDIEQSFD